MFDIAAYAKKYMKDPILHDEKVSNTIVKGDIQPQLSDYSVEKRVKGMKDLSEFLFSIGVSPHTWANLGSAEKNKVSDILIDTKNKTFLDLSVLLRLPRTDSDKLKNIVDELLSKLSDFPDLKSEIKEYLYQFVEDPSKTTKIKSNIFKHVEEMLFPSSEKETPKIASEELIASDLALIEMAVQEVEAADREIEAAWTTIEAARKRKKKWIKGLKLRKGRLSSYKRDGESMMDAARRALRSDDPSVRGMGSFYLASRKFKRRGKGSSRPKNQE